MQADFTLKTGSVPRKIARDLNGCPFPLISAALTSIIVLTYGGLMRKLSVVALATLGTGFALMLAACEPYAPKTPEQMELHPIAARPLEGPQRCR
jgi:hypothetical protein